MMIPILDTWKDDNVTLGYGLDNGDILTQGGDYRFREKQGSGTSKIPLLNQGSVMSDPRVVERLASIDVPVKPSNPSTVDRLGRINVPVKPLLPPAVIGRLGEIDIPVKPDSPQKAELDQAEQELKEEKELDKQTGSEGYEAKGDGVFARLKGFGSSVVDYLFGKDTRSEADKLADQILQEAEDAKIAKEKEEKGVLGYYGSKVADTLLGENYKKDWEAVKEEANKQGWLGYIPQKGATLLENMARSPWARFVDPTTVLGGQQRMVNDIDKYHYQHSLGALRDDLLEQDENKIKKEIALGQTKLGQLERLRSLPPEVQKELIDLYKQTEPKKNASTGYKTLQAAALDFPNVFESDLGREPTLEEVEQAWNEKYPVSYLDALQKPTKANVVSNPKEWAIQRGMEDYVNNPGAYPGGEGEAIAKRYSTLPTEMQRTSYQPQTPEEAGLKKRFEKAGEKYASIVYDQLKEVEDVDYDTTLRDYEDLRNFMTDPANKKFLGGPLNELLSAWASSLGYNNENKDAFLAAFMRAQTGMHAKAIRQINQSGATNQEEQRQARRAVLDMNRSVAYNLTMLDRAISDMSLGRAMKRDEAYLVDQGGTKQENDAKIRKKYGNMLHRPDTYIDPELLDRYNGEDVVYMLDSNGNWAAGMEE